MVGAPEHSSGGSTASRCARFLLSRECDKQRRGFRIVQGQQHVLYRPLLPGTSCRSGIAPPATIARCVARPVARLAPGGNHGKPDRSLCPRPCDRFFALLSACPISAPLARL